MSQSVAMPLIQAARLRQYLEQADAQLRALMAGGGPGASTGKAIEIERLKKLRGAVLGALGEAEG